MTSGAGAEAPLTSLDSRLRGNDVGVGAEAPLTSLDSRLRGNDVGPALRRR